MDIGLSEILLIGGIILVLLFVSKANKAKEIKRQQEEAKAEALRLARVESRSIKYPELQLLGFVVILAGIAMAVAGYLITKGIAMLSVAGVLIVFLGLSFVVLARQGVKPSSKLTTNNRGSNDRANTIKNQAQAKILPVSTKAETRIKPEDMADFKKYQALKARLNQ